MALKEQNAKAKAAKQRADLTAIRGALEGLVAKADEIADRLDGSKELTDSELLFDLVEALGKRFEEAAFDLRRHERTCYECKSGIDVEDQTWCESCATRAADCDGCGRDLWDGFCKACRDEQVDRARERARGIYPHIGLPRQRDLDETLLIFLSVVREGCCNLEPGPCARCQDATDLRERYRERLGAIRS